MPGELEETAHGFRSALLAQERAAASEMVRAYGASWRRVRGELDGVQAAIRAAQEAGADPTALFHQQRRWQSLERQIEAELRQFAALAGDLTEAGQLQAVRSAIANSAALIELAEQVAGLPLVLDRLPYEAVQEFVGFASNGSPLRTLFDSLGTEVSTGVRDALSSAIATGMNPRETARLIRNAYSVGLRRALVIARTEQVRAYREATHQTYLRNADVLEGWIWLSAANRRTCAACWAMHGTFHKLTERLDGHPQCVVGGTIISSPQVLATSKRWFDGQVVEIVTVNGNHLTITKNHPVLTDKGWIAAHLLRVGDNVISSVDSERAVSVVDPNHERGPSTIEDVLESFARSGGMSSVSMPTTPVDFHGDGGNGEVNIVYANSLLQCGFKSFISEPLSQHPLGFGRVGRSSLASYRGITQMLMAFGASPLGIMHWSGDPLDFFGRANTSHQPISLNLPANGNAHFGELSSDYVSGNAVFGGDSVFGLSRKVVSSDAFGQFDAVSLVGDNGASLEFPIERSVADVESLADFFGGESGLVCLDSIVHVSVRQFSGHVYNLETSTGWYIANNIITHNCRCVAVPVVKGHRPTTRDGGDLFLALPEADQKAVLGLGAWEAWKGGAVQLGDFVGRKSDLEWGTMRYRRSLSAILREEEARRWGRRAVGG